MAEVRPLHISAFDQPPEFKPEDKPIDASDPSQLKAAVKEAKQTEATEAETIKWIMGNQQGRKFLYSFLSTFRVYDNPMARDPYTTAFNCGEKNAALWMLTRVESADPALYLQMIEENRNG